MPDELLCGTVGGRIEKLKLLTDAEFGRVGISPGLIIAAYGRRT